MINTNKFKSGDSVNYKNGMDFKDFTGVVESCIEYKGLWHYMVKDIRDNTVKRVGERFLSSNIEDASKQKKNKFLVGQTVSYINERDFQPFIGVVEKCIHNYLGQWQYIVKNSSSNLSKRIDEKHLQLNTKSSDTFSINSR
jgi:hypothetical protein